MGDWFCMSEISNVCGLSVLSFVASDLEIGVGLSCLIDRRGCCDEEEEEKKNIKFVEYDRLVELKNS